MMDANRDPQPSFSYEILWTPAAYLPDERRGIFGSSGELSDMILIALQGNKQDILHHFYRRGKIGTDAEVAVCRFLHGRGYAYKGSCEGEFMLDKELTAEDRAYVKANFGAVCP